MPSQTPNLNLILPVGTEKVSRQIINSNNTLIDGAVGGIINPSVQDISSLASLKTYLLSVASSATARQNVYVQFNVTSASSPFSVGLYTGNMQKDNSGSFSVLCHGNSGGVIEVQYNASNSTWTITNFNSQLTSLSEQIANHIEIKTIIATDSSSMKAGIISACASLLTMVSTDGMYLVSVLIAGIATLDGYIMKRNNEVTGLLEADGTCYSVAYKPAYSIEVVHRISSTAL